MRKSERIRILELEVIRLNLELQYLTSIVSSMLELNGIKHEPDMDAGKWYKRKPNDNE